MRRVVLLRVLAVLGLAAGLAALPAHAAIIDFQLSADDYAKLKIDGSDIALVDTYPGGGRSSFRGSDAGIARHRIVVRQSMGLELAVSMVEESH